MVASANGINNGAESARLKTDDGSARTRGGEGGPPRTGRVVLLPDENPAEFRERMTGLFDSLRPRNQFEISLVERAFFVSWRLDRFVRAQWAGLYLRAHTRAVDEQNRVAAEVGGLTIRLMRAPFGRPAALPFGKRRDGEAPGKKLEDFDAADHPATITRGLEASGLGCKWLLARWDELGEGLDENGLGWGAAERFRAYRMLGIHAVDATFTRELTTLLQACQVIDPEAGSLIDEIWNEVVPDDGLPLIESSYQRAMGALPEIDREAARTHLMTIVKRERTRLEQTLERHEKRAKLEAEVASQRAAIDDSREGQQLERHVLSCEKLYFRYLGDLHMHRSQKTQKSAEYTGAYYRPLPAWFEGEGKTRNEEREKERKPEGGGFDAAEGEVASALLGEFDWEYRAGSDHEDDEEEGVETVAASVAAEGIVNGQPARAVVDRPRLGPGYLNKPVTGSKREKRRMRKLERESMAKGGRKG